MLPVSIDYRFVQTAKWPAQADDVEQAVWWLRENAQALHADPKRIVAIGGSAGGHLAAWLGTTNHVNAKGTPSRVTAVVSLWGPWDLTSANVRDDGKNMIAALVGKQGPRAASPIFRIDAQSAPALLIHGTKDDLVPPDQSTRACDALKSAHVECEVMLLEGEGHGLTTRNADPMPMLVRLQSFIGKHL
jgi:acetyl esterase/lipase